MRKVMTQFYCIKVGYEGGLFSLTICIQKGKCILIYHRTTNRTHENVEKFSDKKAGRY